MKEKLHYAWEDIKMNKVCVVSFLVALISQCPYLFGNRFEAMRWGIYLISMVIYVSTLKDPFTLFKKI